MIAALLVVTGSMVMDTVQQRPTQFWPREPHDLEPLPAVFAGPIRAHRELPADEWAALETIIQGVAGFAESRIAAAKRRG